MPRKTRKKATKSRRSNAGERKMTVTMRDLADMGCGCGVGDLGRVRRKRRTRRSVGDLGRTRSRSGCTSPVYNPKTGVTMCRKRVGNRLVFSHKMR